MTSPQCPEPARPQVARLPDPERKKLLCVNCAHHLKIDVGVLAPLADVCKVEEMFDQVDGRPLYRRCSAARKDSMICGTYAAKFQPKSEDRAPLLVNDRVAQLEAALRLALDALLAGYGLAPEKYDAALDVVCEALGQPRIAAENAQNAEVLADGHRGDGTSPPQSCPQQ